MVVSLQPPGGLGFTPGLRCWPWSWSPCCFRACPWSHSTARSLGPAEGGMWSATSSGSSSWCLWFAVICQSSGDLDTRRLGAGLKQKAPEVWLTDPERAGPTWASRVHASGSGMAFGPGALGAGDTLWLPETVPVAPDGPSGGQRACWLAGEEQGSATRERPPASQKGARWGCVADLVLCLQHPGVFCGPWAGRWRQLGPSGCPGSHTNGWWGCPLAAPSLSRPLCSCWN